MSNAKQYIQELAQQNGFDICNFAKAEDLSDEILNYRQWIVDGFHADLEYLNKNFDKKEKPALVLPNIKSVIVLGHIYNTPADFGGFDNQSDGLISRYAWGDDYHDVLAEKADNLIKSLIEDYSCDCKRFIDTGPVLERAWAVRAGAGWQSKNGNIINFELGSYFFLTIIFTSLELPADEPVKDFCGTCKRCIVACPTGAIVAPKVVDSRKCLSYWTIEAKPTVEIPLHIAENTSSRLFGCDICQEVCPWNAKPVFTSEARFFPRNGETFLNLNDLQNMNQEDFSARFKNSPLKRKKLAGLKAVAKIISQNEQDRFAQNDTERL